MEQRKALFAGVRDLRPCGVPLLICLFLRKHRNACSTLHAWTVAQHVEGIRDLLQSRTNYGTKNEREKRMKRRCGQIAVLVGAAALLAGCGDSTGKPAAKTSSTNAITTTSPTKSAPAAPEQAKAPPKPPAPVPGKRARDLAQLDENRPVDQDSPEVRRFQERLDQLTAKCSKTETEISDLTVRARELLARDGVKRSLYEIVTGVNAGADARNGGEPCVQTYVRYVGVQRKLG